MLEPNESDARDLRIAGAIGESLSKLGWASARMGAHASRHGMDKSTLMVLTVLVDDGPMRSSALAEAVYSDPSTISRQVAGLVADGLVERQADQEDGRASLLAATTAGIRHVAERRQQREKMIATMTNRWEYSDRVAFAALLQRFVADYEAVLPELLAEYANPIPAASGKGPRE